MRLLLPLLALPLISCTHDEIDLDDFNIAGQEGEGEAAAGGDAAGAEQGGGQDGGGADAGDGGPALPGAVCEEAIRCAGECSDDDFDCLINCGEGVGPDDRLRIAAVIGCYDDCLGDAWCIEELCRDEEERCKAGEPAADLTCSGGVVCHLLCGSDEGECHPGCDDATGQTSRDAEQEWGACMGQECGDGVCELDACDALLPECKRVGWQARCPMACDDALDACAGDRNPRCHAACQAGAAEGIEMLKCVVEATDGGACDLGRLDGCLPPEEAQPEPERTVAVATSFEGDPGWEVMNGEWQFRDAARIDDCASCPAAPAVAFHPDDADPRAGWTRLSFTVRSSVAEWKGFASLHPDIPGPIQRGAQVRRFQGVQISPFQGQIRLFTDGANDRFIDHDQLDLPGAEALRAVMTCRGQLGHELYVGQAAGPDTLFHTVSWEQGCTGPPDMGAARLALGGSTGVEFDDVRLELLPCNAPDEAALRRSTGECGVVAHWPFNDEGQENERISGNEPEFRDFDMGLDESGERWGLNFPGHGGGTRYPAVHGGTAAEWTVDAWVFLPPEGEADTRAIFLDWAQEPGLRDHSHGRAMMITPDGSLQCGLHLGPPPMPAVRSRTPVPVNQWAHVGCVYRDRTLQAYVDGAVSSRNDIEPRLRPPGAPVCIGGDANEDAPNTFEGLISDVRFHEIAKSDEYFQAVRGR